MKFTEFAQFLFLALFTKKEEETTNLLKDGDLSTGIIIDDLLDPSI